MKPIVNAKRVTRCRDGVYLENIAGFTKKGGRGYWLKRLRAKGIIWKQNLYACMPKKSFHQFSSDPTIRSLLKNNRKMTTKPLINLKSSITLLATSPN